MASQAQIAERRIKAATLRAAGKSLKEIAQELGVSLLTAHIDCAGVKRGPSEKELAIRKLKTDGMTYAEIASILGVTAQAIQSILRVKEDRPKPNTPCHLCGKIVKHLHCHHVNYQTDEWVPLCGKCHTQEHMKALKGSVIQSYISPQPLSEPVMIRFCKPERSVAKARRGFAAMSPEKQREIASLGGKTISSDKEHMRKIGSKGGKSGWMCIPPPQPEGEA